MSWTRRGSDRRGGVRFDVVGPLRGTAVSNQYVQIREVAHGGVVIESPWPLPAGARLSMKLGPRAKADVRVRHVERSSTSGNLAELELLEPDLVFVERLDELLRLADAAVAERRDRDRARQAASAAGSGEVSTDAFGPDAPVVSPGAAHGDRVAGPDVLG